MKTRMFILVVIFCVFTFSGAVGQEIRVGTILPHTGALKESGPPGQNAAALAAQQMAAAGFEITLVHEDSQTAPDAAVNAAKKLVENDKAVAIVGAVASGATLAVAEHVTSPNDVVLISPGSTAPILTTLAADKEKDFLFRTCPSDALQGLVLGRLAASQYKTASILYVNNPYGQGITETFKKSFEAAGGKVFAMVPHAEKGAESYAAELKLALARGYLPKSEQDSFKDKDFLDSFVKPEVLCVFSYPMHANVYVKEAIDSFEYKSFLFCDGSKSEELIKTVGAENLEGMMGTAPAPSAGEPYVIFRTDFKTEFGRLPPFMSIPRAYDSTAVIGLAAYAAKAKGLSLTSKNIRDSLRAVANPPGVFINPGEFEKAFELLQQGQDINYEGASGSVDFDENGDVVTPIEVWKYTQGKIATFRVEYLQ